MKFRVAVAAVAVLVALALCGCPHGAYFASVRVGPPAPVVYGPVGLAPGPGWVWTDGYYDWVGGGWVWRSGRWAQPPHGGYIWRSPRYEPYRNGYRVHPGHWVRR